MGNRRCNVVNGDSVSYTYAKRHTDNSRHGGVRMASYEEMTTRLDRLARLHDELDSFLDQLPEGVTDAIRDTIKRTLLGDKDLVAV